MHVVFRETHGLDEQDAPFDPGQTPADLIVVSYSDSDLGAFQAGWHRAAGALPSLRLCNIVALRHPVSVDTWVERTAQGAKGILVRLIGGEPYWPYGLASLRDAALQRGIALAVIPGDGRDDPRLDAISTLPVSTLRRLQHLTDAGGAVAAQAALAQMALAAGLYAAPVPGDKAVPAFGLYDPDHGVHAAEPQVRGPEVLVTFYRSYLTSADLAPVDALIRAFRAAGRPAIGAFAPSLKAAGFAEWLRAALPPGGLKAIVNATAFAAGPGDGTTPFDDWDVPVFQTTLATSRRRDWAASDRGLSPADLAMHVALPEVDGRRTAGVISFKAPTPRDPATEFSRFVHRVDHDRLQATVARVLAWLRLADSAPQDRRLALVLSTYPGRAHQMAHAVGLDAPASARAILAALREAGHDAPDIDPIPALGQTLSWPVAAYREALADLPQALRDDLQATWGATEDDPAVQDGAFRFAAARTGKVTVALQPERGRPADRAQDYHDLSRTPRHAYVAFHLWLRDHHALIHIGAHGTLEWLPGKAVALSAACWPEALCPMPVIYPFIVNDPGEAAQAKRRIGAVTVGHLPPPLVAAEVPPALATLERLLDEYATADGLDPARRVRLIAAIRAEAAGAGVEADLGLPPDASPAEAITRIDRFVCDLKDSRFGEGLHVFGTGPCGAAETDGLIRALAGRHVRPGPAGSPARGRADVLPTGRNMFSVDPRAVPSPAAHAQGVRLAEELLRRHLQDHGDWPRGLVVDLWGSSTMRTAGEDFAMALHLAGLKPLWDDGASAGSGRISGFEVLPLALLDRPRIDVTLRVSGLFRDIFPGLAQLFEAGTQALAARDEAADMNPYRGGARVFGPQPGQYGLGMGGAADDFTDAARDAAAEAWLAASSWAIAADGSITQDRAGIERRVRAADAFVHAQDLPESDLLLAADYAAHEAGFAAASRAVGGEAAIWHLDNTRPETPRARSLTEEIARVVRARAANPAWADGMMAHGFRGGAEIAATLEHLAAFAHLAAAVPPHLFDAYWEATLGRDAVRDFLARENPGALTAMEDIFRRLRDAGLWVTRRNSIAALT
jgi:cobaltochelatase CobN